MFQSRETKENLEQCEQMYIEKFKEHIKRDNKQYSDFMRSLVKSKSNTWKFIIEDKEYEYPLSLDFKNFTLPMITKSMKSDTDDSITRFYNLINIGDEITVWGTINMEKQLHMKLKKTKHICILIKTKNGYIFSFGLTTLNANTINENTINICTPDYIFEQKILNQIQKQQNKYVKLISKTTLSKQNYDSIINIFNNANSNDFETIRNIHIKLYSFDKHNLNSIKNKQFINYSNQTNDLLNNTRELRENNINNKFFWMMFFQFNYDIDMKYCEYASSRKGNKRINCASFVEKLLGDLITCTGSSIVTNPEWCHQRRTVKSTPCK